VPVPVGVLPAGLGDQVHDQVDLRLPRRPHPGGVMALRPVEDLPEFTEETARTIVRALLVDYEHVILQELDRSYGLLRVPDMPRIKEIG
jgi:hypothetical protein